LRFFLSLQNYFEVPQVGFGTAGLTQPAVAISWAIHSGYRLLDTASDTGPWYRTETVIGNLIQQLIPQLNITRSAFFITTKLHPQDHGYDEALRSFQRSLRNLNTDYVDLYLLHYPECFGDLCSIKPKEVGLWEQSWRALETLYKTKKVRAIGVSNFNLQQLKTLMGLAEVPPHVVQNYFTPLQQDRAVLDFCRQHHIQFQAYSSLTRQALSHPLIETLAAKYHKSPAQIIIRWLTQENIVAIPKSNNLQHIKENLEIFDFELSADDMKALFNLGQN